MEEFHGGKEKTSTTRRPSTTSTKTWPIVPTGFEHPMEEEEEETTAMPGLEVVEEEDVLTPREERAKRRREKLSVSQRTFVLGGGAAGYHPSNTQDPVRLWSSASMVGLAVGLLLALSLIHI